MRKKWWKRILMTSCVSTLLMTVHGITVLADDVRVREEFLDSSIDVQEQGIVSQEIQESYSESESVTEKETLARENASDLIIEDSAVSKTRAIVEFGQIADSETIETFIDESIVSTDEDAEIINEYSYVEDSSSEALDYVEEFSEESTPQSVGTYSWTVGDGVTATLNSKTGDLVFYSNGGTLWGDWKSKLVH